MTFPDYYVDTGSDAAMHPHKNQKDPKSNELRALESIAEGIFTVQTLLERLLSTERTGAVSSVEVHFSNATKDVPSKPAPTIKAYSGSVPPVEEAVEAYGRAVLLMERAQMDGWEQTVEMLTAQREDRACRD